MLRVVLQRWIGPPDLPSEWAGTGLTSDFPGIVCILDGDRSGAVEVGDSSILLRGS